MVCRVIILRSCALRFEWLEPRFGLHLYRMAGPPASTSTQFSSSFPELENYGGFVNFSHKIFGDQMVLYGDLFYQNATSHDELAPGATGSFQTPGSGHAGHPAARAHSAGGVTPPGTPDLTRTPVFRRMLSIRLTRSIRSSLAAAGRVSSNSAIACSTTKPKRSSRRSGCQGRQAV